jgi:hypothetical protein
MRHPYLWASRSTENDMDESGIRCGRVWTIRRSTGIYIRYGGVGHTLRRSRAYVKEESGIRYGGVQAYDTGRVSADIRQHMRTCVRRGVWGEDPHYVSVCGLVSAYIRQRMRTCVRRGVWGEGPHCRLGAQLPPQTQTQASHDPQESAAGAQSRRRAYGGGGEHTEERIHQHTSASVRNLRLVHKGGGGGHTEESSIRRRAYVRNLRLVNKGGGGGHTEEEASIRRTAYVSILRLQRLCQHTSAYGGGAEHTEEEASNGGGHTSAYVSIRQHTQHTSAYVSIRHSNLVSKGGEEGRVVCVQQPAHLHTRAYVSIREHT